MRGNPWKDQNNITYTGSIPAHAGKPQSRGSRRASSGVYPRACGETCKKAVSQAGWLGLSPRMRGNQIETYDDAVLAGSIPAHAGKPSFRAQSSRPHRVYPRACGETCLAVVERHGVMGLSPRMRGNRYRSFGLCLAAGSIPAHAGKPAKDAVAETALGVYPRACGETPATG